MNLMIDPSYLAVKAQEEEYRRVLERDQFIALKKLHDEQTALHIKERKGLDQTEVDIQNDINDFALVKASLDHEKELLEIENRELCMESAQLDDLIASLADEGEYERKMIDDTVYHLKLNAGIESQSFTQEVEDLKLALRARLTDKEKEFKAYLESLVAKRSELQRAIMALEAELVKTENALLDKKIKRVYTEEGITQKTKSDVVNVHAREKAKIQEQSAELENKIGKVKQLIDTNSGMYIRKTTDICNSIVTKESVLFDERNTLSAERTAAFSAELDCKKHEVRRLVLDHQIRKLEKLNCYSRVCLKDLDKTKQEELQAFQERRLNALYMQEFSIDSKKKRLLELEQMVAKSSLELEKERREMDKLAEKLIFNINTEINDSVRHLA